MNGSVMMVTPRLFGADAVPAGCGGWPKSWPPTPCPASREGMPAGNALHGVGGVAQCQCASSLFQTDGSYSKNTDAMEHSVHDASRGHR